MSRHAAVPIVIALLLSLVAVTPAAAAPPPNNPDDGIEVGTGVSWEQPNGPSVTFGQEANITNSNPWATSNRITLDPWGYFESNGNTEVTVDRWNGTWTNLSALDVDGTDLTVDINDKPAITVGGDAARLSYRDSMSLDDGTVDFEYGGPNGGTTTLTLRGLPANTEIAAVAQDGTVLDAAVSDGSGVVTFDELPQSDHSVTLQSYQSATPSASNLSPTGSSSVSDPQNIQLSADVSDGDFPNDDVTVEFLVEGSVVDTQTIGFNQTVTTTVPETTAGEYNWSVEMSDEFGNTATESSQFLVANELRIYNESAPGELIDNATVNIEFYYGSDAQLTDSRSVENGTVNMTGLPANQPFVVTAETDGYVSRRIFVESLVERQEIYLLPDSAQSVTPTFELRDYTGRFPDGDTVMIIQRSLNESWETVAGDYFGATGTFPATLRYDTRHRIILINTETGDRRDPEIYTPVDSSREIISIRSSGDIDIVQFAPIVSIAPDVGSLSARNTSVSARLSPQNQTIDTWSVEAIYMANSNTTLATETRNTNGGSLEVPLNLTNKSDGRLAVEVSYTTTTGQSGSEVTVYDIEPTYANEHSLLTVLSGVGDRLPAGNVANLQLFVAMLVTVLGTAATAGTLSFSSELVGLTGLGFVAAFSIVGWVPYPIVFVGGVAFVAFAALRRGLGCAGSTSSSRTSSSERSCGARASSRGPKLVSGCCSSTPPPMASTSMRTQRRTSSSPAGPSSKQRRLCLARSSRCGTCWSASSGI